MPARFTRSSMSNERLGNLNLSRVVNYDDLNYIYLNPLDRIARYYLAVAYSSVYRGNDNYNQAYIGARTVAVGICGGAIYITANTLHGLGLQRQRGRQAPRGLRIAVNEVRVGAQGLASELLAEGIRGINQIYFVTNPLGADDRTYHAEMQLVDYFYEEGLRFEGDMMGVSKPCCRYCAGSLENLGIEYSYWHDQNVGSVVRCEPESSWW